jgi:hypothetical protein
MSDADATTDAEGLRKDYAAKVKEADRLRVALERIALRYVDAVEASTKGNSKLAIELCEIARTACYET